MEGEQEFWGRIIKKNKKTGMMDKFIILIMLMIHKYKQSQNVINYMLEIRAKFNKLLYQLYHNKALFRCSEIKHKH